MRVGRISRRVARHVGGNAVAYVALFVALGGTALAAGPMIRGRDVVNSSLTGKDVRDRSLTGKDVRDGSLTRLDVAAGTFLGAGDKAADAARLEGHPASDFLTAGSTVANATNAAHADAASTADNAAKLDGHPPGDFLAATGTAADSSKLDGHTADEFARHPLYASVTINGSAGQANGLTSSKRYTGVYFVQATDGRDLSTCAVSVHLGVHYASFNVDFYKDSASWAPPGEVATYFGFINNDFSQTGIVVVTRDSAGTTADKPFVLSAVC